MGNFHVKPKRDAPVPVPPPAPKAKVSNAAGHKDCGCLDCLRVERGGGVQAGAVDVWGKHVEFVIASARAREAAKAAEETREFQRLIKERSMSDPTDNLIGRLCDADALHMRMLSEMVRPAPGSPDSIAWLALEAYREVAHATTAALSAAVGEVVTPYLAQSGGPPTWFDEWFIAKLDTGERVVLQRLPEEYTYDYTTADATYYAARRLKWWMQFPDSAFKQLEATTPQPSAAEDGWGFSHKQPWHAQEDATEDATCRCDLRTKLVGDGCEVCNPDAAVGAQVDGEPLHDYAKAWSAVSAVLDEIVPDWIYGGGTAVECAESAIRRLAAPAAGKGVDDAMVERAIQKYIAMVPDDAEFAGVSVDCSETRQFMRDLLEAALTRQRVAGDGMVLVRKEKLELLRTEIESVSLKDMGYRSCGNRAYSVKENILCIFDALAPAATPTDSRAGS